MIAFVFFVSLDESSTMDASMSDAKCQKEYKLFIKYYDKLKSLLPISSLTPRLVSREVITVAEEEEISRQKALLFSKIDSALSSGFSKSFYELLAIMKEYGGDIATLAFEIDKKLTAGV